MTVEKFEMPQSTQPSESQNAPRISQPSAPVCVEEYSTVQQARLTAVNRLFELFDFCSHNKCHFPLPNNYTTGKTTLGTLSCTTALTDEQKRALGESGLLTHSENYSTLQVVNKTIDVDLNPEFVRNEFPFLVDKLFDIKHPNLVPYLNVSIESSMKKVTFLSPTFNCRSLDVWFNKFKGSFPKMILAEFARSVGAQLLFGLSYLHQVGNTAHGDLKPTNILLDDEGHVAINDYNLVREVAGTAFPKKDLAVVIQEDLRAVARILFCIAADTPWETITELEPEHITEKQVPHTGLRAIIVRMLTIETLSETSAYSCLVDPCFITASSPSESPVFTIPKEVSGDTLSQLRILLNNNFKDLDKTLLIGATSYIKTNLVPYLSRGKTVASSPSEWLVKKTITANVDLVELDDDTMARFRMTSISSGNLAIVKTLRLNGNPEDEQALRRSVTILDRAHHPNIVRMFAATRQGNNMVRVITEAVELGSLKRIMMNHTIPRDSIVDFLMGVTCQVLNALLFLHVKLNVAHRDLSADHILLDSNGCVKLCGFNSSGRVPLTCPSDMQQLSTLLLWLAPKDSGSDAKALRNFAVFIKNNSLDAALKHPAMARYYSDNPVPGSEQARLKQVLVAYGVSGSSVVDELKSWRSFDEINPSRDLRQPIWANMKGLTFERERGALLAVERIIKWIYDEEERLLAQLPVEKDPTVQQARLTAVNRLFELFNFNAYNGCHFPLPNNYTTGKTTLGTLSCTTALTDEQKRALGESGLLTHSENYSTLQVVNKTIDVDLNPEFVRNEFPFLVDKLFDIKHPNLVPYLNVSIESSMKKVTFLSPTFNCRSLDVWFNKFKGSFPKMILAEFARSVGAQLLFGLSYLHQVGNTAHGDLKPTNILLDDEGHVAINDYNLVREVAGTAFPKKDLAVVIQEDLRAVARILFCIAADTPWETITELEPEHITEKQVPHTGLRAIIVRMLTIETLSETSAYSCLVDPCFITASSPSESPVFTIPKEVSGDTLSQLRILLNNNFKDLDKTLLIGATSYIKTNLVPYLSRGKTVASSPSEWLVKKTITANVDLVELDDDTMARFRMTSISSGNLAIVKTLRLNGNPEDEQALRRSVTILDRAHHPNIVRMFAATRQGNNMVRVITEAVELGSLKRIMMNHTIPRDSIVDFLMGVTCQVLNALLFLHAKLNVAHRDLNANHILLDSEGRVRLCSFNSSGRLPLIIPSDMQQLSILLLRLAPKDDGNDAKALRDFAAFIKDSLPDAALMHPAMAPYYSDNPVPESEQARLKQELVVYGVSGSSVVEELKSWRRFDETNPSSYLRYPIQTCMKRLILERERDALLAVKRIIKWIYDEEERLLAQEPNEAVGVMKL